MNVEDLIVVLALSHHGVLNDWDRKLVYSFADQIGRGNGFTEKQSAIALKIIKRHSPALSLSVKQDIDQFLENPTYRYPFRKLNNAKRISVYSHPELGHGVRVEFPYNEDIIKEIRSNRNQHNFAQWNPDEKSWTFALTEDTIEFLATLMSTQSFECDEIFQKYIDQRKEVLDNLSNLIPMLDIDQGLLIFKNIPKNLPKLEATDIIPAMFEARRRGIFTWSDKVVEQFNNSNVNQTTSDFLKSDVNEPIHVNCENNEISCLTDIIKYMSPCLFVIPGGHELKKLTQVHEFLKTLGIPNEELSVMFRLDSNIDKNFNNFVKENGLNSPITENTKIVFISSKLPKPVLKSKLYFNSVINMGFGGVHYSIRDYVGNHENLVYYTEKKIQKEFDFVIV
jgi:hypothetical protein